MSVLMCGEEGLETIWCIMKQQTHTLINCTSITYLTIMTPHVSCGPPLTGRRDCLIRHDNHVNACPIIAQSVAQTI